MHVKIEHYPNKKGCIDQYHQIRDFLIEIEDTEYSFARWDWMITHSMTKAEDLDKIALWKEEGRIVGLVIFDIVPDMVFIRTLKTHKHLRQAMVEYAMENFVVGQMVKIMIQDDDRDLQSVVYKNGFKPSNHKEFTSILLVDETSIDYDIPNVFKMVSLKEAPSVYQYYRLFWRGFNHELEGEGPYQHSDKKEKEGKQEIFRENNRLDHKIIIQNEKGDHICFCGLWYDHKLDFAIVEPLATDPDYRRLGLAKACMYEGIKRVKKEGAKRIIVNTSKQFYYNRGFRPYRTQTLWEKKIIRPKEKELSTK